MCSSRRRPLSAELIFQRDADALQGEALLLVVVAIEQVVHAEQHGVLGVHSVRRAEIDHDEVRVIDDRRAGDVEVLILASLNVAGREPARERADVEIEAGADGIGGDVQNVPLAGRGQLLPPARNSASHCRTG